MSKDRSCSTPSQLLEGVTIGVEHGYLCVRDSGGWLLWSKRLEDAPISGFDFADMLKDVSAVKECHDKEREACG